MWEVCWAAGGGFHLLVLAALVLAQQDALLRLKPNATGFAEMHRLFSKLEGTLQAAPLLQAARRLEGRPGVGKALKPTAAAPSGFLSEGVSTLA